MKIQKQLKVLNAILKTLIFYKYYLNFNKKIEYVLIFEIIKGCKGQIIKQYKQIREVKKRIRIFY